MTIVMLKSDEKQHKIDKRPPTTGPYNRPITANCMHTRVINLMELSSGIIYKRSYRNIIKMLPSQEILSTMSFPMWLEDHPLTLVNKTTDTTITSTKEAGKNYMEVLKNIAALYTFLSPILPSVQDSHRTIKLYRGEDDPEAEIKAQDIDSEEEEDKYNLESDPEEEDNSQRKEDDDQPKDNRRKTVQFSQSHLLDTEQEEENNQIEDDNTTIIPRQSNEEDGILPHTNPEEIRKPKKKEPEE